MSKMGRQAPTGQKDAKSKIENRNPPIDKPGAIERQTVWMRTLRSEAPDPDSQDGIWRWAGIWGNYKLGCFSTVMESNSVYQAARYSIYLHGQFSIRC